MLERRAGAFQTKCRKWVPEKSEAKVPKIEATFKWSELGFFGSVLRSVKAQNTPHGLSFLMSTKTWVFGSSQVILRWFYGKVPFFETFFQMVITWVFWKRFEVCKSSKYSSWSQLSDEYKNMGVWIIPGDPTVILRKSTIFWDFFSNGHNLGFLEAFWGL